MGFWAAIPATAKVLCVFVLVLVLIRKKVQLGTAFTTGAVGLGVVFLMTPLDIGRSLALALLAPKTLSLALVVCLILVMSETMEAAGQMKRLLSAFHGLVRSPRINLIVFPSLIGLLPMPGGAVFSAPMVRTLGSGLCLSAAELSYINYWFRHMWEIWWPLYPGVLLSTSLAGLNLWTFITWVMPLPIVAMLTGYWPLSGMQPKAVAACDPAPAGRPPFGPFFRELVPIVIVIALGLAAGAVLGGLLPKDLDIAKELGLILALLVATGWVWRANRLPPSAIGRACTNRQVVKMFYMVAAILMFKGVLEDSGAVKVIAEELIRWHIPLMPLTMFLPFFVGFVAGWTMAMVGAVFPILITLVTSLGEGSHMLAYVVLAMGSGYVGMMLSPLHLCFLLSNEFFSTSITKVYRYMALPCTACAVAAGSYFLLLRYALGK